MNEPPQDTSEPQATALPPEATALPPQASPPPPAPPSPPPVDRKKRNLQIAVGLIGWVVVNLLFAALYWFIPNTFNGNYNNPVWMFFSLLPFGCLVVNIGAVILLVIFDRTRYYALGILAGMALMFALGISAGIIFSIYCLISLFTGGAI
jgi:hypothetical protein